MTYAVIGRRIHRGRKFEVAAVAERQHGVVSRRQLRGLGTTDSSISDWIAGGYLHPVFRGVFAVGHRDIGSRGRMFAATLACGDSAVVSHGTAAALLGLHDRAPAVVDVIAQGQCGRRIDGIRRHRVPPPRGGEVGHCDGTPCTSPTRTIVDLAGTVGGESLRRTIERAAVMRVLDAQAIERLLATRRRRGAPTLRRILRQWRTPSTPRLRSELEARLLGLVRASDLPDPICNRRVDVGVEEAIEVDFLWPERRVVVETDGRAFHDSPRSFERDRKRDRVLQLRGYRVLRFTHRQVEREPDAVVAAIRRLLTVDFG